MSFEYLDQIVKTSNSGDLLELFNLSFGATKDTTNSFELLRRLRNCRPMERCLSVLMRDPASRELIEKRQLVAPYCSDTLLKLPQGTLGRSLAEINRVMNYDLNFHPKPDYFHDLETAADYVNYRVLATHDIHHILTGFAMSPAGETGVLSVSVQQFAFPGFAFIDIATLLKSWLLAEKHTQDIHSDPERIQSPRYKLDCIVKGMTIGEEAQLLFPIDWHALMEHDLEALRAQLGIRPVREGTMSWHSDPVLAAAVAGPTP